MSTAEVRVYEQPVVYEVGVLPLDHDDAHSFRITVEWRGGESWAVLHMRYCLGVDGEWDWEAHPSERSDDWLAAHRFPLDEALRLAREAAPGIRVNGRTAAEVAAESAR